MVQQSPDDTSGTGTATGTTRVKRGMAEMLKGGVIMDVVTAEQAKIAEDAGAVAVMALERVPSDIRATGGVAWRTHVGGRSHRRRLRRRLSELASCRDPLGRRGRTRSTARRPSGDSA